MASGGKGRKAKVGEGGEGSSQAIGPIPNPPHLSTPAQAIAQAPPPPQITPQAIAAAPQMPLIKDEERLELTNLMQELLLKTHELSFEYSTSDCDELPNCSLARKSKELFKVVKRLHSLMRKVAPADRATYVS